MTVQYRDERVIPPTPLTAALTHVAGGLGKAIGMSIFVTAAIWGYQHPAQNLTALVWLGIAALVIWFAWALTSTPAVEGDGYSAHNEEANTARSKGRQ